MLASHITTQMGCRPSKMVLSVPQVWLQKQPSPVAVCQAQGWGEGGERVPHHRLDREETRCRVPGNVI